MGVLIIRIILVVGSLFWSSLAYGNYNVAADL